jgi:hypothetical protein
VEETVCCKIQELYAVTNFRNEIGGGVGLNSSQTSYVLTIVSSCLRGCARMLIRNRFRANFVWLKLPLWQLGRALTTSPSLSCERDVREGRAVPEISAHW